MWRVIENVLLVGLTCAAKCIEWSTVHRGNSSVGRAQPCQGWGREFESRFPLQIRNLGSMPGFFRFLRNEIRQWNFVRL